MALSEEDAPKKVLVIEEDEDLAYLLESVLGSEGYDVQWLHQPQELLATVRRYGPDVIVLDVEPLQGPYRRLDKLRVDPTASRIPLVATTTSQPAAEGAVASYNVRALVLQPFDIDLFLDKVREALGEPPLHAALPPGACPSGLLAEAERILAERLARGAVSLGESPAAGVALAGAP